MSGRGPTTAEDWNEVGCMKEAEKLTNIHVDFGLAPSDGVGEKRNLALTSGDYPEVFYRTGIPAGDIAKYGEQGTFVPLNEPMDEHTPNRTAIRDEKPTSRQELQLP